MTQEIIEKPARSGGMALNIGLWIAQILLAFAYGSAGFMKATQPLEKLAVMMQWVPQFAPWFVRSLGVAEFLGAIGIILPWLTRIQPRLTVAAAIGFLLVQAAAVVLHLSRGEANVLPINAVLIALSVFVIWGRGKSLRKAV